MRLITVAFYMLLFAASLWATRARPPRGDFSWVGNTQVGSPTNIAGCLTAPNWCIATYGGVQIGIQVIQTDDNTPAFYYQVLSNSRNFDITVLNPPVSGTPVPPCSGFCTSTPPAPPAISYCPSSLPSTNNGEGTPLCSPTMGTQYEVTNCSTWTPLCSGSQPNYLEVYGDSNSGYMSTNSNTGTVTFSMPAVGYGVAFVVACGAPQSPTWFSDCQGQVPAPVISAPASVQPGDFNSDGYPDLMWQNNMTEQATVWYMGGSNGATYVGWNWLNSGGEPGWRLVGAADFDGDGVPDLVWQKETTREVTVNYYGGTGGSVYQGWQYLRYPGVAGYTAVAVADVDGNGIPDVIYQNDTTNQISVNYYGPGSGACPGANCVLFIGWQWLNSGGEPPGWKMVAAADFDGNGVPDLVWEYKPTRQTVVNYYTRVASTSPLPGGSVPCACMAMETGYTYFDNGAAEPGWTLVGANDFNLDGVPDLVWQNDVTAQVTVNYYGGFGGASFIGWAWLDASGHPGWTPVLPR